ncbi:NAD(P)-binding protein [Halomonas sp. DN3]|uniref:NAD(P)-binding protein n=1 Tax=Halomonas sp. DN3 TaxID=2953657 RepID=UPI00209EF96F|nr:NAD(P)-binding protein [Halomonas sp. DN3]USZ51133.1 NAD(P)-binding protein [Halomonas sp. DN3]
MNQTSGRIAIIGGGPIGLAACAHALAHGLDPVVIEAGTGVGEHLRQWGHVRMFTPWECNLDDHAAALLKASGWQHPAAMLARPGRSLWSTIWSRWRTCLSSETACTCKVELWA